MSKSYTFVGTCGELRKSVKRYPILYQFSYDAEGYDEEDWFDNLVNVFKKRGIIAQDSAYRMAEYQNGQIIDEMLTMRPVESGWLFRSCYSLSELCEILNEECSKLHYVLSIIREISPYFAYVRRSSPLKKLDDLLNVKVNTSQWSANPKSVIEKASDEVKLYHFSYDVPDQKYDTKEILTFINNNIETTIDFTENDYDESACVTNVENLLRESNIGRPVNTTIIFYSIATLVCWANIISERFPDLRYVLSQVEKDDLSNDLCHINPNNNIFLRPDMQ